AIQDCSVKNCPRRRVPPAGRYALRLCQPARPQVGHELVEIQCSGDDPQLVDGPVGAGQLPGRELHLDASSRAISARSTGTYGKNTVADRLTQCLTRHGHTVVIADVDDVAAMVGAPGAAAAGRWFAAHQAHGALVGQWMRSDVDYVVAVGPFWTPEERQ